MEQLWEQLEEFLYVITYFYRHGLYALFTIAPILDEGWAKVVGWATKIRCKF